MEITKVLPVEGEHPVDRAARVLGGRLLMAERLGVSAAAVGNWKQRGVPIEHCTRIERLTLRQVTRRDLRPDDYLDIWPELADAPDGVVASAPAPLEGA